MSAAPAAGELSGFDRLLAELSARFVSLSADEIDRAIPDALGRIGSFLDVDRVGFLRRRTDRALVVRHCWSSPGVEPIVEGRVMGEPLPHVFEQLSHGEVVRIGDTGALGPEWRVDQKEFRRSGAKAHLSMPFAVAGEPLGSFFVVSVRERREWSDEIVDRLRLLIEVLANAIKRGDTERRLRATLAQVLELQAKLEAENLYLRHEVGERFDFEGMVGSSEALAGVVRVAERVAPTDVTVLIQGETGTGKEIIARAIHARSRRSSRPLIRVNCAALPSSLAESELFGHEKGAFTGAVSRRPGRFEVANRGTIFLDEVGDLPLDIQAKLLRVLQEGEFERLGSTETRATDVRVLAATSHDLAQAVEQGRFRSDLLYRLRVVPVELPPLRARREDIPELVWFFIERFRAKHGGAIHKVPAEVMKALKAYDWPGNVRELENIIERAVVLSTGPALSMPEALTAPGPRSTPGPAHESAADPAVSASPAVPSPTGSREDLAAVERAHIVTVLDACGGKVKGPGNAAERLGLNPSTLRGRMRKLGIQRRS